MEIISTFIGPAIGLIGSIIVALIAYKGIKETNAAANDSIQNETRMQQALLSQKLDSLTDEVRLHNNFARRLPVVEEKIENIDEKIDKIDKRVSDLEKP